MPTVPLPYKGLSILRDSPSDVRVPVRQILMAIRRIQLIVARAVTTQLPHALLHVWLITPTSRTTARIRTYTHMTNQAVPLSGRATLGLTPTSRSHSAHKL